MAASAPVRKLNPRQNTVEQIHAILREEIIGFQLRPGEAIPEKDLCQRFGVSRTPIREACQRLSFEGLVEILPQRGTFVSRINLEDVREDHFIRMTMEAATVQQAAASIDSAQAEALELNLRNQQFCLERPNTEELYRLDQEFHRLIAGVGHSAKVWRVIDSAKLQLDRVRVLTYDLPQYLEQIVQQHRDLFEAIAAHHPDQAVQALQDHLNDVLRHIETLQQQHPEYFN